MSNSMYIYGASGYNMWYIDNKSFFTRSDISSDSSATMENFEETK